MNADQFVKLVRGGAEKLRVDDVILNTGVKEIRGKGMMRITRDRIEVDMTLNAEEDPPLIKPGIYTKRDAWKLSGVIESHLHFKCEWVGPCPSSNWCSGITTLKFSLGSIDLVPSGLDSITSKEREQMFQELQARQQIQPLAVDQPKKSETEESDAETVYFLATLFEYPLVALKSGTEIIKTNPFLGKASSSTGDTFLGEHEGFEFAFIKQGETKDLQVHLRSKKGHRTINEAADWLKFYALMKALALAHGVHAWPYRIEYWRAGKKIRDSVQPATRLARSSHAPFTERLAASQITKETTWDLLMPIQKAVTFFELDSVLSKEVAHILFLFREADDRVHSEITTLAMCTLFESLVRLIFKELELEEKAQLLDPSLKAFHEAKTEICVQIDKQISGQVAGYTRLRRVVGSASPFSQRELFQAVSSHLGLKWEGDMESIFEIWKNARNPLVHGKARSSPSEDVIKQSSLDESRIAGAINILVLKLIGYSGWLRSSAFEDGYRQI